MYSLIYAYYKYKRYQELIKEQGFISQRVDIKGCSIHYLESKTGTEPLVMIHGLLDASFGFRKLIPFLNKKYKIFLIDIPGFGKTKLPSISYLYQLDIFADILFRTIQSFNFTEYTLLGHSMGGLLSQHIALKDKKIKKLILLSTGNSPHPERNKMREILFPKNEEEISRLLSYLYYKKKQEPNFLVKKTLLKVWNTKEFHFMAENTIEREDEIFFGKKAKNIRIPTLIISGKEDEITTKTQMIQLKKYITGSKLVLIENAKHAIHLEHPQLVANEINKF
jgi:pimeloyl-ACP methyl ester carboxylesterase